MKQRKLMFHGSSKVVIIYKNIDKSMMNKASFESTSLVMSPFAGS